MIDLRLSTREKKFSDVEFSSLERNSDGDVIDLEMLCVWFTDAQIDRLTSDDWYRANDVKDEVAQLYADFLAEEF